jgi:hypothetical protein
VGLRDRGCADDGDRAKRGDDEEAANFNRK